MKTVTLYNDQDECTIEITYPFEHPDEMVKHYMNGLLRIQLIDFASMERLCHDKDMAHDLVRFLELKEDSEPKDVAYWALDSLAEEGKITHEEKEGLYPMYMPMLSSKDRKQDLARLIVGLSLIYLDVDLPSESKGV